MAKASSGAARKSGDVFDVERIRDLIDLMEERGLYELDLKQTDQQIRLVRGALQNVAATTVTPVSAAAPESPPPAAAEDSPHVKVVKAPMVGTFYGKPNPNAENFVNVGSKVSPDTVLCIIEAMKVFNEIPAEVKGTIIEVLANNEEAVDYGRPLFKVDTRG
jgi:acetyl-CoA carboxylase biotin carboxyl carrier protein